jgi:hypothetical protein
MNNFATRAYLVLLPMLVNMKLSIDSSLFGVVRRPWTLDTMCLLQRCFCFISVLRFRLHAKVNHSHAAGFFLW